MIRASVRVREPKPPAPLATLARVACAAATMLAVTSMPRRERQRSLRPDGSTLHDDPCGAERVMEQDGGTVDLARAGRLVTGGAMVAAGTAMMVLPGPGILTVLAGLAVLQRDVPLAGRALAAFRRRWDRLVAALPGPAREG